MSCCSPIPGDRHKWVGGAALGQLLIAGTLTGVGGDGAITSQSTLYLSDTQVMFLLSLVGYKWRKPRKAQQASEAEAPQNALLTGSQPRSEKGPERLDAAEPKGVMRTFLLRMCGPRITVNCVGCRVKLGKYLRKTIYQQLQA